MYVLEQLTQAKLTLAQAAQHLGLCQRHVLRLKAAFAQDGAATLAHKSRGRPCPRATPQGQKEQIVALAQSDYKGASLAHLAELLAHNQQISVSAKTLGRILAQASVPRAGAASKRPRPAHKSRERRPQEGLLVQIDASPFNWLEGRGPQMSLHGAIDDATGKVLGLSFRPTEDTLGYLHVLWQMVTGFGLPTSFYSDRHTLFFSPKTDGLTIQEELAGKQVPLTQIGRVLEALRINHIPARSPQAKGRVERLWQTLQARLTLELRLASVCTLEAANAFLPDFLARFNARFALEASDPTLAWRPAPAAAPLETIICLRHERKATRGSTFSFEGTLFQLRDQKGAIAALVARRAVQVLLHLDGSRSALYEGSRYALSPLQQTPRAAEAAAQAAPLVRAAEPKASRVQPAADHPWRRSWSTKQRQKEAAAIQAAARANR